MRTESLSIVTRRGVVPRARSPSRTSAPLGIDSIVSANSSLADGAMAVDACAVAGAGGGSGFGRSSTKPSASADAMAAAPTMYDRGDGPATPFLMPGEVRVLSSPLIAGGLTDEIVPCVVMLICLPATDCGAGGSAPDESVSGTDGRFDRDTACAPIDVRMRPELSMASASVNVRATDSMVCGRFPGSFSMQVITSSYANAVSSFFGAKFGKHVEELLVSPLPNWVIVGGYATGGIVRGVLVGLAVSVVSLVFTHLHVQHPLVIVSALLLTSLTFALGGFLNALFAKNFDQVNWIPAFVLTPLTYFGGVFYSINLLPQWARTLSFANPILYMVNAFRFGFLGVSDVDVAVAFALMAAAALVLFTAAVMLMNRGTGIRE